MTTSDPSVSERAADFGINLFDSARGYQNGNNARMVGAARVARGDPLYGANSAALSRRLTQKGVPVAAIKWALQNEGVDIAIVCMTSHDQSDVNFRGMAEPLTEKDEKLLTAQPAGISS